MTAWTDEDSYVAFNQAFDEEKDNDLRKTGVDPSQWRAGGRISKAWPNKEDELWWRTNGPGMVTAYKEWRESTPWAIYITPAGLPAIELELHPVIKGVPVKMFIDRVFITPNGEPVIVDLKTGSRTPDSDLQLGFYRVGLEKVLGIQANLGAYWMSRQGGVTPLADLSRYDEHLIGTMLNDFNRAVENEIFLPHLSSSCKTCGVNRACAAFGGAEARAYDPLHPNYSPVIAPAQLEVRT